MPLQSPILFRICAASFAIVLSLQATWILAAELLRPKVKFPGTLAEARAATALRSSAATAAWIGWPRGELRTDYAVTANAGFVGDVEGGALLNASNHNNNANGVAETAATLSPSDARAWLLLAMNAQAASNADSALARLKMSYYTSSYDDELFPLRIQIAARLPSVTDGELSGFVEYELGVVTRNKPTLKGVIASAYRAASPAGRQFLEITLAKLDPKFLAEVKATRP
jgi:hypothetical protein